METPPTISIVQTSGHSTDYQRQLEILRSKLYPDPDMIQRIVQAKHFIDRHFARKLRLEQIAENAFLSKSHFLRLFKRYYGVTPIEYLRTIRIRQAKFYLSEGREIAEVCRAIGFDSVPTFVRTFRAAAGETPGAFQRFANKKQYRISATPFPPVRGA